MPTTVSNTSPICNLAAIGRLDLLRMQFGEVLIPGSVLEELRAMWQTDILSMINDAVSFGWLKSREVQNVVFVRALRANLHAGESEAIALALEAKADRVIMDEREGRQKAKEFGLQVTGVIGVLLRAKRDGSIRELRPEIDALRSRAGFYLTADFTADVLRMAGEVG